jgi:rare lipoprotein A
MRLLIITSIFLFTGIGLRAQQVQKQGEPAADRKGVASYYHDKFEGRPTATGEIFDNEKFTAASNHLKLGTYVRVTNLTNGRVIYVRINDRMAPNNPRLIDLASIAAEKLDFKEQGLANVKLEIVPASEGKTKILAQREDVAPANDNEL